MSARRSLIVVCCLLFGTPALATTWTDLDHAISGPVGPAVLSLVQSHAARYGAPQGAQLAVERVMPVRGGAVVRVTRTHQGRTVFNAGLSVLVLGGKAIAASGRLDGAPGSAVATMSAAQAGKLVTRRIAGSKVRHARPGFWRLAGELRPVWSLDVARMRPFDVWRVVVDASSGRVLSTASTVMQVAGEVYHPNPSVGQLQQVELKGLTTTMELAGDLADVSSCSYSGNQLQCTRYAQPDASGDFIYAPEEPSFTDGFSEVTAYYNVDAFHRWMQSSFGFARKGATQQITVMVNFSFENSSGNTQGMYNALFGDMDGDGRGDLVFGQGQRDYAYDADVIYHEFTHSVVHETSALSADLDELGLNAMPVALNEAFADLFSSIYAGDGVVGEYAGNGGIRTLTGAALSCPDQMIGEEHNDGLLWSRACWTLREKAQDTAVFDDVLYKTLVGLDQQAGFADAAALFVKVAGTVDQALATAAASEFASRGLDDCSRIVPLTENQTRGGNLLGLNSLPSLQYVPGPVQYKVEVPEQATQLRINLSRKWGWPPSVSTLGAYIRKGLPVSFAGSKANYDFVLSNNEDSILLDRDDPKQTLEAGATYYVIPLNVGAYDTSYKLTIAFTMEEPPPTPDSATLAPDAGVPALDGGGANPASPDEVADTGCSCQLQPAATLPLPVLLLLGLGLVLLRRRG